ncbi:replication initiator [Streptacidiphilus albus]|uniref:replication initiator n=1 Tax=Streptacidiphilus albus TaxID=105425 RepID=UPI0007C63861|nr:replication initiator [Streptacidiphilus albus]
MTFPSPTDPRITPIPAAATDLARVLAGHELTRSTCTRPIRLVGSRTLVHRATGEIVHDFHSAHQPNSMITVPCGNRRHTVCPSCSTLYKYDAYHLIAAGLRGGKNTTPTVAAHPRIFVTLTAPSFGPVHLGPAKNGNPRPCGPRRTGPDCHTWHPVGDPLIGTPLDPGTYDYTGHVLFNAYAGALWSRFTTETRRTLADLAGIERRDLRTVTTVAFAKVAEYQTRGVVHFHAVIRLDGANGPGSTAPARMTTALLTRSVRTAAKRTTVTTPSPGAMSFRTLRWGRQLDIRTIGSSDDDDSALSDAVVARYVAKYATKGTEASGIADLRPLPCRTCDGQGLQVKPTEPGKLQRPCPDCHGLGRSTTWAALGLSNHALTLVRTCWKLGGREELAGLRLRRWAHTFGFRGHFATKSRSYSTTFGALRDERAAYTAAQRDQALGLPSSADLVVVNDWHYAGRGPLPDTPTPAPPGQVSQEPAAASAGGGR